MPDDKHAILQAAAILAAGTSPPTSKEAVRRLRTVLAQMKDLGIIGAAGEIDLDPPASPSPPTAPEREKPGTIGSTPKR